MREGTSLKESRDYSGCMLGAAAVALLAAVLVNVVLDLHLDAQSSVGQHYKQQKHTRCCNPSLSLLSYNHAIQVCSNGTHKFTIDKQKTATSSQSYPHPSPTLSQQRSQSLK